MPALGDEGVNAVVAVRDDSILSHVHSLFRFIAPAATAPKKSTPYSRFLKQYRYWTLSKCVSFFDENNNIAPLPFLKTPQGVPLSAGSLSAPPEASCATACARPPELRYHRWCCCCCSMLLLLFLTYVVVLFSLYSSSHRNLLLLLPVNVCSYPPTNLTASKTGQMSNMTNENHLEADRTKRQIRKSTANGTYPTNVSYSRHVTQPPTEVLPHESPGLPFSRLQLCLDKRLVERDKLPQWFVFCFFFCCLLKPSA